jgi:hypothetical protein
MMVCMHTAKSAPKRDTGANERLRELVDASGMTQAEALAKFNEGMGLRPIALSTWKGYFVNAESTRWRGFDPGLLAHAERVLKKRRKRV